MLSGIQKTIIQTIIQEHVIQYTSSTHTYLASSLDNNKMDSPLTPLNPLPVRPLRCKYCSLLDGIPTWITCVTERNEQKVNDIEKWCVKGRSKGENTIVHNRLKISYIFINNVSPDWRMTSVKATVFIFNSFHDGALKQ